MTGYIPKGAAVWKLWPNECTYL